MKKMISMLLSLVLVIACCVPALATEEKTVTFSFSQVSGKAGDIVYVDFSVLEENTYITNFGLKFVFDFQKVERISHPETKKWFKAGPVLTTEDPFEQAPVSYVFKEEIMELYIAEPSAISLAGVIGTFAFRLLEDIPQQQGVMACRVMGAPLYYPEMSTEAEVTIENNLDFASFSSIIPGAMQGNKVTFWLESAEGKQGDIVFLILAINEVYSYIGEFELEFSFDTERLQLVENPQSGLFFTPHSVLSDCQISFDKETCRLSFVCENGLAKSLSNIGILTLQIIDANPQVEPIPVTMAFIKEPVHYAKEDFVYDVTLEHGSVLTLFSGLTYEKEKEGAIVTGYQGNQTSLVIPVFFEGIPVVGVASKAFANNTYLKKITLTNYVTQIADDAFEGCNSDLKIHCGINSVAETFAKAKGFAVSNFVSAETVTNSDVLPMGDVHTDGIINAKDALRVLKMAIHKCLVSEKERMAADVNRDGYYNAKDALEILKKAVGKPACF